MLLTITTSRTSEQLVDLGPASHLSFLLHKHPDRVFRKSVSASGEAVLWFPQTGDAETSAFLGLIVDPLGQVKDARPRGNRARRQPPPTLATYINDQPYASASHFASVLRRALGSALDGRGDFGDAPAETQAQLALLLRDGMPLELRLPCVKVRRGAGHDMGESLVKACFEALGYVVKATSLPLDPEFPEWGDSNYVALTIKHAQVRLRDALRHLYVLLPALGKDKHYSFNKAEVGKLAKYAAGWLDGHPHRKLIVERYVRYDKNLIALAGAALAADGAEDVEDADVVEEAVDPGDSNTGEATTCAEHAEARASLNEERLAKACALLRETEAQRVLDLGCNTGKLTRLLAGCSEFAEVVGVDADPYALRRAARAFPKAPSTKRLRQAGLEAVPVAGRPVVTFLQSSITQHDERLLQHDTATAAALVEVIEHIDPERLPALEANVFGYLSPEWVLVTTPNREYNALFGAPDSVRHGDHRFEWTRVEFEKWAQRVARKWHYEVYEGGGIGTEHLEYGHPTQWVMLRRRGGTGADESHGWTRDRRIELALEGPTLPNQASLVSGYEVTVGELPVAARSKPSGSMKQPHVTRPRPGAQGVVRIPGAQAREAMHMLARHTVDPRWLIYLPPTMSPCTAAEEGPLLERPEEALRHYARHQVERVVCQEKHMGSRAIVVLCRSKATAKEHFGDGSRLGVIYTRTGRAFFDDLTVERDVLDELHTACARSGLWEDISLLGADWVVLDCEVMPWSAKAQGLIRHTYAPVGTAMEAWGKEWQGNVAEHALRLLSEMGQVYSAKTADPIHYTPPDALPEELASLGAQRLQDAGRYRSAYREYCWETEGVQGLRIAPFHVLACDREVFFDKPHEWHTGWISRMVHADKSGLLQDTEVCYVDPRDPERVKHACEWWASLVNDGKEGMVVKPASGLLALGTGEDGEERLVQPAIKCRGPEYLRIIYGPEYQRRLDGLRKRSTGAKRHLARRQHLLGWDALRQVVAPGRAWKGLAEAHRRVLGVLALGCDGLDPRL